MIPLRYVMLFVSDLERSIRFYRDAVGLPVLSEARDQVEFDAGGVRFTVHQAHTDAPPHQPPTRAGSVRLGFHVDDLDATHERLLAAGVRVTQPPEERFGIRMGLYEDPDGYHFTLAADVPS